MGVIRHKTWYDLWESKGRTIQAVLIIAIGAFAIGTTMGGGNLIRQDISRVWRSGRPAMIGLEVDPAVDDAMIEALEDINGVKIVEGRLGKRIKWRLSSNASWRSTRLMAWDDYERQEISRLTLDSGAWPHRKTMAVERGHGLRVADQVYLEIDDKEYLVDLGGVIYNTNAAPAGFGGDPIFYTTRERFSQLSGERNYSTILATLKAYDPVEATTIADMMQRHLEKQNYEVDPALEDDNRVADPDRHFIQDEVDGVFFLLTSLAITSLMLGLFLVYNTVTAIISQQVNQIGIMKAIGATFYRVLLVYFSQVFVYALLALLLAIPLGAFGAHWLRIILINLFNMEPGPLIFLPKVMLIQLAVALFSPLIVAIFPVFSGARITVREAISSYGLGGAAGLWDRLLVKIESIPQTIILTLSNTFRSKSRVFVTQLALVGSGLVFMMVMNTQASLLHTYGQVIFETFDANVFLNLQDKERIEVIEEIVLAHPQVTAVETWGFAAGTVRLAGQPESNDDRVADIRGLPVPAQTYIPQMRAGRWLQPDDTYAMVINQELAKKIGAGVGDWITLKVPPKRESTWQVVGLLFEVFNENAAHVPRDTLLKEIHQVGRVSTIRVQTQDKDAASEAAVAGDLRQFLEANGFKIQVGINDTAHRITEDILGGGISIVINLLAAMAVVIAIVGGVSLSGVLSINVLERRREIGVMRAIGASSFHIFRLFIGEGLLLGWLSWLIALPLSIPAGALLTYGLSAIMGGELSYTYSLTGPLYWFGVITALSIVASIIPARGATRISVRESLVYL